MEILNPSEQTRREGVEASPVRLADGNSWGLALPAPRFRPEVIPTVGEVGQPDQLIRLTVEVGYPLEIRRRISDLRSSWLRDDPPHQYEALMLLATSLLRRAHEIEPDHAAALLDLSIDDLPGLVDAVLTAVMSVRCIEPTSARKKESDG